MEQYLTTEEFCAAEGHEAYFKKHFQITGYQHELEVEIACRNCSWEWSGTVSASRLLRQFQDDFYRVDGL